MYRKDRKDEFYTLLARKEGYPARSVYKLKEIDEKCRIIKRNDRVLDLGSSPGSWLLYLSEKVGNKGRVVGIDIEELKISIKNNALFYKHDVLNLTDNEFKQIGAPFDAVVADLSPKTTGVVFTDVGKSLELAETAFEIAKKVLKKGGNFVCKLFEGEDTDYFVREVENLFESLKRFRPRAVIKRSKEFYIVAKGYGKGN